ncbi:MAG: diacylglycerol kinase family protein [Candidatus Colwellbacteria bacterium]|nr:diacylglycerol kinase family protein [Candidatus Colwellbacteria bacterium]
MRILKSIKYALDGLKDALMYEKNFRIFVVVAGLVIAAMVYFPTTTIEKLILIVTIFMLLALELINSVIERIMDFIQMEHHQTIKEVKDIMAFIVLLASVGAAIVGVIIFWPYLF